jgi:hypothetical protein
VNKKQRIYESNGGYITEFYRTFQGAALTLLRNSGRDWPVRVFLDDLQDLHVPMMLEGTGMEGPLMRDFRYFNATEINGRITGRVVEENRASTSGIRWDIITRTTMSLWTIRQLVRQAQRNNRVTTVAQLKDQLGIRFNQNFNAEVLVMMIELEPQIERFFRRQVVGRTPVAA